MEPQGPDNDDVIARTAAQLDGNLRELAAESAADQRWWERQAERMAGDEGRRTVRYGPGGYIDVVPSTPVVDVPGARVFRVVRRGSVTTPTAQVEAATAWLGGRGFTVVDAEPDDRIGVSRLQLASERSSSDLLEELRGLRYSVPRPTQERLCIGPDDITMEGMHAKAPGGADPRPAPYPLTPRPTDDDRGAGVTVAVIDGGFERRRNTRSDGWTDNVTPPRDDPDPDPTLDYDGDGSLDDGAGHGTFVTGVLLQVAPAATVLQYRALDSWGMGNTWRLKDCLLAAAADGARIINLSLGFDDVDLLGSPALSAALTSLPPEILVVAAAGNSGSAMPSLPAAHSRCIGVGALKAVEGPDGAVRLTPCAWSSFGPWVEFSCVGLGVLSTFVEQVGASDTNPASIWAGTSFAAPQISGLLAVELGRAGTPGKAVTAVHAVAKSQTGSPHPDFGHMLRVL